MGRGGGGEGKGAKRRGGRLSSPHFFAFSFPSGLNVRLSKARNFLYLFRPLPPLSPAPSPASPRHPSPSFLQCIPYRLTRQRKHIPPMPRSPRPATPRPVSPRVPSHSFSASLFDLMLGDRYASRYACHHGARLGTARHAGAGSDFGWCETSKHGKLFTWPRLWRGAAEVAVQDRAGHGPGAIFQTPPPPPPMKG